MNTKTTLFQEEERAAVENRFQGSLLYDVLAGTCRRIMNKNEDCAKSEQTVHFFKLHPTELFYQSFFLIDVLRRQNINQQKSYCNYDVWEELKDYIREDKQIEATVQNINLVICTILRATAELMIRSLNDNLLTVASDLLRLISSHIDSKMNLCIIKEFNKGFQFCDTEELAHTISDYWKGKRNVSEEIEKLIEQQATGSVAEETPHAKQYVNLQGCPASKPSIRIAKRKKTSAIVVLNAMYQAGWFVDEEGNQLTSRDKAINEILKNAFGEEKDTAISQTLKPSNCTNSNKNQNLLRDLLDKDNLMKVIEEIQADLLNKG